MADKQEMLAILITSQRGHQMLYRTIRSESRYFLEQRFFSEGVDDDLRRLARAQQGTGQNRVERNGESQQAFGSLAHSFNPFVAQRALTVIANRRICSRERNAMAQQIEIHRVTFEARFGNESRDVAPVIEEQGKNPIANFVSLRAERG